MAFVTDKEELKPGLIIFLRQDVQHRNWYCRVKLPKVDRYKTGSLKTEDIQVARDKAIDHDADIRSRLKHDVPVFNRSFEHVGKEYVALQETRAARGEISKDRPRKILTVIDGPLQKYVGTTQVHLIGQDSWEGYPAWRRENGVGRYRDGRISDSTIRLEMSIFQAEMSYAVRKRHIPASQRFENKPKRKTTRRGEFTLEEYRKLHTAGRAWVRNSRQSDSAIAIESVGFPLVVCKESISPCLRRVIRLLSY